MSTTQTLPAAFVSTVKVFTIIFALLLVYAVLPVRAHAAALTDTQTQAIISLLSSFGADQSVLSNVQLALHGASRDDILKAMGAGVASSSPKGDVRPGFATPTTSMGSSTPAIACVAFDRTLNRGATGDDVSALQAFLMHTGDLQGTSTTGFFGSTTEAALKAWQAKQGIATSGDSSTTGAGVAGPKTRAALETSCLRMKMDEQNKMRIQEKRVASSTPPQTPQGSASGPQSNASSLGHVSSLMASGAAAVWEGYLSLFGGQ